MCPAASGTYIRGNQGWVETKSWDYSEGFDEQLHMSKVSVSWVPCLLMPFEKKHQAKASSAPMVDICTADEDVFS